MATWFSRHPGLVRLGVIAAALTGLGVAAGTGGWRIEWAPAVVYGVALAHSMRWPIVLPGSGAQVILVTGLLLEAAWHYGLPTALALMFIDFGVRLAVLHHRGYWNLLRPFCMALAASVAYGLAVLVGGQAPFAQAYLGGLHVGGAPLTLAYVFWMGLHACWVWGRPVRPGRSRLAGYAVAAARSWWVPLLLLVTSWPLEAVRRTDPALEALFCLALVWIQYYAGTVFTALNQDWAVNELLLRNVPRDPGQRGAAYRVMHVAHAIGRTLRLPSHEIRRIGYAALLQDEVSVNGPKPPRWLAKAPTADERPALREAAESAARLVEKDASLDEVADLIRLRYTSYDGSGEPPLLADQIPLTAQVLSAANAMVALTTDESGPAEGRVSSAAAWIATNAARRFNPLVMLALQETFLQDQPAAGTGPGLLETVRQLKGLVGVPDGPTYAEKGLRHIWFRLRGRIGFAPDLPREVRAVGRMATILASSTQTAQTAQIFVDAVGELVEAKVALGLGDVGAPELLMRIKAAHGLRAIDLVGRLVPFQGGQLSRALLSKQVLQVADVRELNSSLARDLADHEGIRSLLVVPLMDRGRAIGMLFVGTQSYHWFTPQEAGLIQLMAGQAAIALENARLMSEAEERVKHISSLKALTDTLLDNLTAGILVVDPEGLLLLANATARSRFADAELQVGQLLPDDLSRLFSVTAALVGEHTPEVDVTWRGAVLEVQAVPLRDNRGTMLGAICLARDVTQVRSMQEQVRRVEKLAAMGELAAGAAHEIRNPLTSIRGFIQLLQARAAGSHSDYFKIILSEIDRIDEIIRDLLLLARPSPPHRMETTLTILVEELLLLHQAEFERQGIAVVRDFNPNTATVDADVKMLRQLLLNLLINAGQAMPYGGNLGIRIAPAAEEGYVVIEVSDTGVGISPENLKRLFVPFFTTKEEGTGLGLALCYSIVQSHHGRIDVESQVGLGTTFRVTLPRR